MHIRLWTDCILLDELAGFRPGREGKRLHVNSRTGIDTSLTLLGPTVSPRGLRQGQVTGAHLESRRALKVERAAGASPVPVSASLKKIGIGQRMRSLPCSGDPEGRGGSFRELRVSSLLNDRLEEM